MDQRDHEVRCMRLGLAVSRTWWPKTCPSSWTVMEHHAATKKLRHKFVPGEGKGCVPCLGFRALWESFLWRRCVFWMAVHAFSLGCSDAHLPSDSHHRDPNLNLHLPRLHPGASKHPHVLHVSRGSSGSISPWFFLDVEIVEFQGLRFVGLCFDWFPAFTAPWWYEAWEKFHWAMRFRLGIPHPKTCFMSSSCLLMEDILHHPGSIQSGK